MTDDELARLYAGRPDAHRRALLAQATRLAEAHRAATQRAARERSEQAMLYFVAGLGVLGLLALAAVKWLGL